MKKLSVLHVLKAAIIPQQGCMCGSCAAFRRSGAPRSAGFFNLDAPTSELSPEECIRELKRLNRGDYFDAVLCLVAAAAIIVAVCLWSL